MLQILKRSLKDKKMKKIKDKKIGSWISVVDPDKDDFKVLEKLGLDMVNVKDALDANEVPRTEKTKDFVYVFIRTPIIKGPDNIQTIPVLLAISKQYIITVCGEKVELLDILVQDKNVFTTQRVNMLVRAFLSNSKLYERTMNLVFKKLRGKKAEVFNLKEEDIISLVSTEEILEDMLSAFVPTLNVYRSIISGKVIQLYDRDKDIIEDVIISGKETLELSKSGIKTARGIRDSYSTLVTMRTNYIIKILTGITIIFTVPTIIASIYGMNVGLPLQQNFFAFNYILVIIIVIMAAVYIILKKKQWI